MKKSIILSATIGVSMIVASGFTVVRSTGVADWSGSPVDGGTVNGTCGVPGCHSGGATVPTLAVSTSPAFGGSGTNLTYTPGTTYNITITASGSYPSYGFNCELINSQSTAVGTYPFGTFGAAITSNCQIYPASGNGGYPDCASHNQRSTTPWTFKWTAPTSGTGYLYADVNGVNDDASVGGDRVSAVTAITLTPQSTAGIATHTEKVNGLSVFPNPATDNVRITYTLKECGMVSVKLYNLNGELVADLLNETQDIGMQNTNANLPAGLAKGLYMVKLNVNGEQTTEKLMVR